MTRVALAALAVVGALSIAAPARAEDVATYQADGAADAAAADARTRALDVAFAAATRLALADLVAPADAQARRDELERQVVSRARLWVASFKVVNQLNEGGRLRLTAAVKVDRDKLRAKLAELGVAVAPPAPAAPHSRGATVLLRVTTASGGGATFGAGSSTEIPGAADLAAALEAAGLAVVPPPASTPAPRPAGEGGELPIDDAGARAAAAGSGAELAIVVSASVDGSGAVRASRRAGALARAHARLIGADGAVLGDAAAMTGAHADSEPAAINAAIGRAAAQAVTAALPAGTVGPVAAPPPPAPPPPLTADAGEILVRLTGAGSWGVVAALRQQLASTAGVQRVVVRRLSAGEVVLAAITGQRADRIAAAVRTTPGARFRIAVKDAVVDAVLEAAPPAPAPAPGAVP